MKSILYLQENKTSSQIAIYPASGMSLYFNANGLNSKSVSFKSFNLIGLILSIFIVSNTAFAQLTYKELRVEYDSAWTFKNLQIVPVRYKMGNGAPSVASVTTAKPVLFAEALQKHKVKLQEIQYENGADVNWLQVTNHSKQDVLIQSGEILDGGKQDRMVGETKIVAAGATDYLHVYCVEKRRWTDKPKEFKTSGVANSDLQKTMNLKGRQSEIWREIDRQFAEGDEKSETVSYVDLYKNKQQDDSDYIRFFLNKYSGTDSNFAGFIFITGNKILSTELFATAQLTNLAFKNMLSSYVPTARKSGGLPKVPVKKQKEFMDKILTSEAEQKTYVTAHGKLEMKGTKVIHLIAYDE